MIIDCIADLHGHYPDNLEGGDLLIVAGDLTARDLENEHALFDYWIKDQKYKKKIVIAGNHDRFLEEFGMNYMDTGKSYFAFCDYLYDSGTEFEYFDQRFPDEDEGFLPSASRKLKIWGSPWTLTFPGINPKCTAFTGDEKLLAEKFALIPDDIDILITHGPPKNILDKTIRGDSVGSTSLLKRICELTPNNLRLVVFGHIHESYGHNVTLLPYAFPVMSCIDTINCSHVNERYEPVNKPVRIIL